MVWRIHRDESRYTDRRLIAWHWALPYLHVPILDSDEKEAGKFEKFIEKALTDEEAGNVVRRLELRKS